MTSALPLPPRDTHGPTPLAQCAPIADLAARARELDLLSQRLVPLLPAPLRDHVQYAALHNDRILLLVESSIWASRVRMEQRRVLDAARSLGLAATSVTAKVVPIQAPSTNPVAARPPTPRAAQHLRAAADATTDPDLRMLFRQLAALVDSPADP